ncbi:unnamed protein product, partial [marine sediment metagenome]
MLVFEEAAEAFCFDFGDDLAAGFKQWGVFETKTVYDAFEWNLCQACVTGSPVHPDIELAAERQ